MSFSWQFGLNKKNQTVLLLQDHRFTEHHSDLCLFFEGHTPEKPSKHRRLNDFRTRLSLTSVYADNTLTYLRRENLCCADPHYLFLVFLAALNLGTTELLLRPSQGCSKISPT